MKPKTKRIIGYGMFASFLAGCFALMSARLVIEYGWGGMARFWLIMLGLMLVIGSFACVAFWLTEAREETTLGKEIMTPKTLALCICLGVIIATAIHFFNKAVKPRGIEAETKPSEPKVGEPALWLGTLKPAGSNYTLMCDGTNIVIGKDYAGTITIPRGYSLNIITNTP